MITPDWPAPSRVRAAFTLRSGGVSAPPYESLNVGARAGDLPANVVENRRRIREQLRLSADPVWLHQVHGTHVVRVGGVRAECRALASEVSASESENPPQLNALDVAAPSADAAVTNEVGCVLAIQVADCMPVLFCDRDGTTVAAAHAGWRGLSAGVLEAVVKTLSLPPRDLLAWMGPAIGTAHFEVGEEVRAAFIEHDAGAATAFSSNERGRWQCDLYALARRRLTTLGVSQIYGGTWCTYHEAHRFFSYRRDGVCGRMAALIWLEGGGG